MLIDNQNKVRQTVVYQHGETPALAFSDIYSIVRILERVHFTVALYPESIAT